MTDSLSENLQQSLGLTEDSARVYLAVLELGQCTMQEIAKKSGVNRSTIYTFIDDLKSSGFIFETKKQKRRLYSAAHPEHLVEIQKSRLVNLQMDLPELLALHNTLRTKPRVTFFEGVSGIEEVYADTLREKKAIVAWSDFDGIFKTLGVFATEYPKERARRGIGFQTITVNTQVARQVAARNLSELREMKFLSKGEITTEINVYGDKVAMISFRSTYPFAVLIEDAGIANTLRLVWKSLWECL